MTKQLKQQSKGTERNILDCNVESFKKLTSNGQLDNKNAIFAVCNQVTDFNEVEFHIWRPTVDISMETSMIPVNNE